MKLLAILIFFLGFMAPAHSQWRNSAADPRANSKVFSQFKYFSFYSDELSGHIAYVQLSPAYLNRFYILANIVSGQNQHTMLRQIPAECVVKSLADTEIDACGTAGIFPETDTEMKIYNKVGPVQWNITVKKSPQFNKLERFNLNFPPMRFFERIIDFGWSISWQPIDLAMQSSGMIRLNESIIEFTDKTTYHDDTWGDWNFMAQPYFWLYFANPPHSEKKFQLVLGDIYFNRKDRLMGMRLMMDGREIRYSPEDYSVVIKETRPIGGIPLELFGPKESYFASSMESLRTAAPTHEYPHRLEVLSHDKRIRINITVSFISPYLAKIPFANLVYGDVWHDDMVVDVDYEFKADTGELISGRTKGGMEFFQTKDIGLPFFITAGSGN